MAKKIENEEDFEEINDNDCLDGLTTDHTDDDNDFNDSVDDSFTDEDDNIDIVIEIDENDLDF